MQEYDATAKKFSENIFLISAKDAVEESHPIAVQLTTLQHMSCSNLVFSPDSVQLAFISNQSG